MEYLLIIWVTTVIILVGYYILLTMGLLTQDNYSAKYEGPVSIIICARNEAENLRKNLPYIFKQRYDQFEVVVVNDRSTDESADILKAFSENFNNLKVLERNISDGFSGKKGALRIALENCNYEKVLLTDADCGPASDFWLRIMASHFSDKKIILGYGAYQKQKGWLNKMVRWETLFTAIQYFGYARLGIPYMGVGRNLAYNVKLFQNSDRFASHKELPSGDDDLFVSNVATVKNVATEWRQESFTYSKAPQNFDEWWRQKQRHLSTAIHYKPIHKFILGLSAVSLLLFYILMFLLIPVYGMNWWFWIIILLKFGIQLILVFPMAKKLDTVDVILLFPIWEFLFLIFATIISIKNTLTKPKHWK